MMPPAFLVFPSDKELGRSSGFFVFGTEIPGTPGATAAAQCRRK
jgi:hypothetical protein